MSQKPKILIVEDDRTHREFLEISLSDSYEVTCVDNFEDAQKLIAEHAYDTIITDNQFPAKPGGEVEEHAADVIKAVRASVNNGNTPIIVHSGNVDAGLRDTIDQANDVQCVIKGGSPEELPRMIADCVKRNAAAVPIKIDPHQVMAVEAIRSPILVDPIKNILVLDYYNGTAEAMKGLLEEMYPGAAVDAFHTLEAAFEGGIRKKRYDLIISNCERTVKNGVDSPSAMDISDQLHAYVRKNDISHNLQTPIVFYGDREGVRLTEKYQTDSRVTCIGAPDGETIRNAAAALYERIQDEAYAAKMKGLVHPDLVGGHVDSSHVDRVVGYRGKGPAEPTPGKH